MSKQCEVETKRSHSIASRLRIYIPGTRMVFTDMAPTGGHAEVLAYSTELPFRLEGDTVCFSTCCIIRTPFE